MKYDHPNFAAAVKVLASQSEYTDEEVLDAVASITSTIEAERPGTEAHEWQDWVESGEWYGTETIESTLAAVDEILED